MRLEFRILGPVEVVSHGCPLDLGPRRQRLVLVRLLLSAGRPVSVDQLLDDVWGGSPPGGAVRTLRSYLSRLRTALATPEAIMRRGGGYVLEAGDATVDAVSFAALVGEGRELRRNHNDRAAATHLREALALWRGPALADLPAVPFVVAEAFRLEEERLTALEDRVAADLACGRHSELVGELEGLVEEHPLRERLWAGLMTALYRAGRQAEALRAFQRARAVLVEELGVEPGEDLRLLEQAILRQELPAPESAAPRSLPTPLTPLIGREVELRHVVDALTDHRLVTVVGAGGAGKTRVAIEVGWRTLGRYPDGVWMVDLGVVLDPDVVPQTVVAAVGVQDRSGRPPKTVLAEHLAGVQALLVLDNCEHVLETCAELAQLLLQGCPRLRILATSREVLAVPGEVVYDLPPLPVPPAGISDPGDYDAVRLFLARSPVAVPADALASVARVCRELDGLPLAIEIAAAQTRLLAPAEIADRLTDRFRLLTYWSRTAVPRHTTLRASLDWSYMLLQPHERALFHRLAVFVGGFTLSAAEAVAASPVLDDMRRLVDASLVLRATQASPARFRLLETVRQYALERALATGDADEALRRHAAVFASLADRAYAAVDTADQGAVYAEVDAELGNIRAALEWAFRVGDTSILIRVARGLGSYWRLRGSLDEGAAWLQCAIDHASDASAEVHADLIGFLAFIEIRRNDFARAQRRLAAAVELLRQAGGAARLGYWLHKLAFCHRATGDYHSAKALLQEAAAIAEANGSRADASHAVGSLADVAMIEGRFDDAENLYDKAWSLAAPAPPSLEVPYLHSRSSLALAQGQLDQARQLATDGLKRARELGDQWHVGLNLTNLAYIAVRTADHESAAELLAKALDVLSDLHDAGGTAEVIDVLTVCLIGRGDMTGAATARGAAEGLRAHVGVPPGTMSHALSASDRAALDAAAGADEHHAARTRGRTMTLDEAVQFARRASATLVNGPST